MSSGEPRRSAAYPLIAPRRPSARESSASRQRVRHPISIEAESTVRDSRKSTMRATRQPPSAEISIDDFREMMHRAKTARRRFRKGHTPRRDAVSGPRHVPSRARTSSIIFTRATRPVARLFARSTPSLPYSDGGHAPPAREILPRGGRVRRGHEPAADHARGTPPDHPRAEFHRAEEDAFRPESQGPRRDFAPPLPPATIPHNSESTPGAVPGIGVRPSSLG